MSTVQRPDSPWLWGYHGGKWLGPDSVELQFDTLRSFFQSKYEQVQKNLGEVQKQLEEAQQKIQLNDLERSHTRGGEQTGNSCG